jgi:hypothetical protein
MDLTPVRRITIIQWSQTERITGGAAMPIRRYLEKGIVFTPQALSAMTKALEATTEILGIGRDEAKRQAVARFIIRLAQEDGSSFDAAALRDKAVATLGGTTYCGPPESGQALASAAE